MTATPIPFRCVTCGHEQLTSPNLVGKRVRCPRCQELSTVMPPLPQAPEAEEELPVLETEPSTEVAPPDIAPANAATENPGDLFIDVAADESAAAVAGDEAALDIVQVPDSDLQMTVVMEPNYASDASVEPFSDERLATLAVVDEETAPPPFAISGESRWKGSPPRPPAAVDEEDERPRPSMKRKARQPQEADMDMTPMVDVTFLLLIFFMVTASFTMQKSLSIPKPESDQPSTQAKSVEDYEENPDYVVVRVDSLNTFYVSAAHWDDEREAPSEQELLVKLRQAREDGGSSVPTKMLVIASGEALHERVVMAIDAGNDVGMEEVQLLSVEDDEAP